MIRVIIADDIPLLRQSLELILEEEPDIEVTGLACNGKEAYLMCLANTPDVIIMDMRMPDFDGSYGTRHIKKTFPKVKVLVFTTFDDEETVSSAMASGADGYILKEMENDKIIRAVKAVYDGINVFGGAVYKGIQNKIAAVPNKDGSLTDREYDIISLIAKGMDNKEISNTLYLAEGTVRNSISRILEKLNLKDRTQIAVYAVKNNLV